ncbi:MAG: hypothetical protein HUJ29_01105 [Gammaproteobacteria bacterium]|nr:hypothetical protein [Gammaproteobacteria bacterium]
MRLRIVLVLLSLGFSAQAMADAGLYYEDNQQDYRSWGYRGEGENLCAGSNLCGMYVGFSLDNVTVQDVPYISSFGHLRFAFAPNGFISPYVMAGIDLLETAVLLLSDGEIAPRIDSFYGYGLRITLGDTAISLYHRTNHLTGLTIQDGYYRSYGVSLSIPLSY